MSRSEKTPAQYIAEDGWIDLGSNHACHFFDWVPDRDLNPQYGAIPDIRPCGASVAHLTPKGEPCEGAVHFASEAWTALEALSKAYCEAHGIAWTPAPVWQVHSLSPLHLSPSLLCKAEGCGDHGFIENGRWRVA
jgi:hypothetical protein